MYPVHFMVSENNGTSELSSQLQRDSPNAQLLTDLLAPNSADELSALMHQMKKDLMLSSTIELFSIQHYAIWPCKIFYLQDRECWLVCKEDLLSKNPSPEAVDSRSEEHINNILHQNTFYEALLQQLPAEVAVFDPDLKFLFVNQNAIKNEELRKWLIGRSEIEYWKSKNLPIDKALARVESFKDAIAQGKSAGVEEVFHPGTENEKHYMRITHPYFKDGALQFLLTYGIEITALKKSEKLLIQQNVELEKLNAELDQFVYSASHNLRAPLLSMKGLLGLISLEDTAVGERTLFMNEVYKSIERLDETIHDIIEYSKNTRLDIEPLEVDIDRIIQDAQEDLKFYEDTHVDIQISIAKEATLFSDARRIKSIIHNIMSNAVKYADTSKDNCWASVQVNLTSTNCSIVISDNGIGIAKENIDRVFDMFYRGTSQRTGSGLGLYIVKEMVQKLGGAMAIESSIGQGTTIRIDLPNRI